MTEMPCNELVAVITDYLEGTLPAADGRRFEEHLGACPFCTSYLEQMRATIARTGDLPRAQLSSDARAGLLDAFRDARRRD